MGNLRSSPRDAHLVFVRELLDAAGIERALRRIAGEIVERSIPPEERHGGRPGVDQLLLVGIRSGGVPLAERIARLIGESEGRPPSVGAVDITLYRDDVFEGLPKPEIGRTDLPRPIAGRKVVLVDDVLFTGRTVRAAIDVLMDYGRPRAVELAALVDRGHRELPIHADYVGLALATTRDQSVRVSLLELDGEDRVILRARPPEAA